MFSCKGDYPVQGKLIRRLKFLALFVIISTALMSNGDLITRLNVIQKVYGLDAEEISWSDPIQLTNSSGIDSFPSVIQTMDGNIWIVWQSSRTGNDDIWYSIYNGSSWSNATQLTRSAHDDMTPSAFQSTTGDIWVCWYRQRGDFYELFYNIYNGSTWRLPDIPLTDSMDDKNPSILESSNNTIWVFWTRKATGNRDIYYMTSHDYGGNWSNAEPLIADPYQDKLSSATQAENGTIWVTWSSDPAGDWVDEILYRTYNGTSWSDKEQRTYDSACMDWDSSIVQAANGTMWIVWAKRENKSPPPPTDLWYMTLPDGETVWSDPALFNHGENSSECPSIVQMANGSLLVAFGSDEGGESWEIYYKVSSAMTFHDVAITNIAPSNAFPFQGETISINVTAENQGNQNETFEVACYVDSVLLGSENVYLTNGTSTTLTFPWDTSTVAFGKYVVKANASAVPGENIIKVFDNTLTYGVVMVRILGDITGPEDPPGSEEYPPDGTVDIYDLTFIMNAYGKTQWDLDWDEYRIADLTGPENPPGSGLYPPDGAVDINDLTIVGKNYGKAS